MSLNAKCSASEVMDDSKVRVERSLDDGYKWRKYGKKMVKGSKFPRSYYKCRHPKCEVKKILERSYTGQTTEIAYKGTHDHPKPQPSCLFTAGALMSKHRRKIKIKFYMCLLKQVSGIAYYAFTMKIYLGATDIDVTLPQLDITNNEVADDLDMKRGMNIDTLDVTPVIKPIREPRLVVQTMSEVDIMDDGYRWRKYGQKVVRCNPNPRSYYKCTSAECPEQQQRRAAQASVKAKGNATIKTEANDAICLDLSVGNKYSEQQLQPPNAETIHSQAHNPIPVLTKFSNRHAVAR
ncbi:DNA-binding WRKY [Artemisia annua]|uniref:DNA-binding WRKY n=1 Tax=Artemisia annua TaxID=35608 RepID=A0A2U1N4G6_ARTAN|nr:DNA-binding WRKY [Artemisia annua]